MPQGNLVEVLGREVRQGSPGELMVESSPSRQRRPPCKTDKEMSDDAADAAAPYVPTYCVLKAVFSIPLSGIRIWWNPLTRSIFEMTVEPPNVLSMDLIEGRGYRSRTVLVFKAR